MELHKVNIPSEAHIVLCADTLNEVLSDAVFQGMQERVDSNPSLIKTINGVFLYYITKNGKTVRTWSRLYFNLRIIF